MFYNNENPRETSGNCIYDILIFFLLFILTFLLSCNCSTCLQGVFPKRPGDEVGNCSLTIIPFSRIVGYEMINRAYPRRGMEYFFQFDQNEA